MYLNLEHQYYDWSSLSKQSKRSVQLFQTSKTFYIPSVTNIKLDKFPTYFEAFVYNVARLWHHCSICTYGPSLGIYVHFIAICVPKLLQTMNQMLPVNTLVLPSSLFILTGISTRLIAQTRRRVHWTRILFRWMSELPSLWIWIIIYSLLYDIRFFSPHNFQNNFFFRGKIHFQCFIH